jgi:hypothetical protein
VKYKFHKVFKNQLGKSKTLTTNDIHKLQKKVSDLGSLFKVGDIMMFRVVTDDGEDFELISFTLG